MNAIALTTLSPVELAAAIERGEKPRCCYNLDGTPKRAFLTQANAKLNSLKQHTVYACALHGFHLAKKRGRVKSRAKHGS